MKDLQIEYGELCVASNLLKEEGRLGSFASSGMEEDIADGLYKGNNM